MDNISQNTEIAKLATEIVKAIICANDIPENKVQNLTVDTYSTLSDLVNKRHETNDVEPEPAIDPENSITPDYLICLEDGKKFKSLKRHLRTSYDLTPDEYIKKWKLPPDYPMVSPNYSKSRSKMAKAMGLGSNVKRSPANSNSKSSERTATAEGRL